MRVAPLVATINSLLVAKVVHCLLVINQMLRLYAAEQNWDKGPEGMVQWAWGPERKRQKKEDASDDGND
jgi:hypothetical protein